MAADLLPAAAPVKDGQVAPRSRSLWKGSGHRRSVLEPTRQGDFALRRREDADAGPLPHSIIAAHGLGLLGRSTYDYIRHGTTTLFAALDVASGEVITQCEPRHRHQESHGLPAPD